MLFSRFSFPKNLLIFIIYSWFFLFSCLQPVTPIDNADRHLQLPAPVKQFLISPPSSPPIGWEPRVESAPLINYDLIAAIASLSPGMILDAKRDDFLSKNRVEIGEKGDYSTWISTILRKGVEYDIPRFKRECLSVRESL